jgi:hypothetical protein
VRRISNDYGALKQSCDGFNSSLKAEILQIIIRRKEQLSQKGEFLSTLGIPVRTPEAKKAVSIIPATQKKTVESTNGYDVAISFAGEDRTIAEAIAEELKKLSFTVFYDRYEQANLWGKDLYAHLSDVYVNRRDIV